MKKIFAIIFSLGFCTILLAGSITEEEAREKAIRFLQTKPFASSQEGGKQFRTSAATVLQTAESCDAYYVFNIDSDEGFVIVSGEESTPDVLGFSSSGAFDSKSVPSNVRLWLNDYASQINAIISSVAEPVSTEAYVSRKPIAPLLTSKWGQESPYNLLCPMQGNLQCVTGCVATAMAQVMNYWQHPTRTTASIPNRIYDFEHDAIREGTLIDWGNMPATTYDVVNNAQQKAVSELMLYCGMAVDMNYGCNGSGAYGSNVVPALKNYFGYGNSAQIIYRGNYEDWLYIIYNELRQGHPVYYSGASSSSGHAFVCDGYVAEDYYHIDWGWNGSYNGYFRLCVMNPDGRGTGGGSRSGGYTNRQAAIVGCVPSTYVEKSAPIAVRSIAAELTKYQRTSKRTNFLAVTLTPDLFVTGCQQENEYGLALYQGDNRLSMLYSAKSSKTVGTRINNTLNISFGSNLSDGSYQIVPVCRRNGETEWERCLDADKVYLEAEIEGLDLTLKACEYEIGAETFNMTCVAAPQFTESAATYGVNYNISFTLHNDGGEYVGPLCILSSTNKSLLAEQNISIASGETRTLNFTIHRSSFDEGELYSLGGYGGISHVAGSEFSVHPRPHLKATWNIPALNDAELDEYGFPWVYDDKISGTLKVEYPKPDGNACAPDATGNYEIRIGSSLYNPNGTVAFTLNLKAGESVEIPFSFNSSNFNLIRYASIAFFATNVNIWADANFYDNDYKSRQFLLTGGAKPAQITYYAMTSSVIPAEAGYISSTGRKEFEKGETYTLTAKTWASTTDTYYFDYWEVNGERVCETQEFTFTVTGNMDVKAHFKEMPKISCLETPIVDFAAHATTGTLRATIWNEGEDFSGKLRVWVEGQSSEVDLNLKADETREISISTPLVPNSPLNGGNLLYHNDKMGIWQDMSGSHFWVKHYPSMVGNIIVHNVDATNRADADSLNITLHLERQPSAEGYKGRIPVRLVWGTGRTGSSFGSAEIDVDLLNNSAQDFNLTYHSGNAQTQNTYSDFYDYPLRFKLYTLNENGGQYETTLIGDSTIYYLKKDWGARGRIYVYTSSGGTVGLKNTIDDSSYTVYFSTGMTAHAHATPDAGYYFKNWTDADNNVVSTDAYYTFKTDFTQTAFYALKANFVQGTAPVKKYIIKATASNTAGGTVTGAGTVSENEIVTLKATEKDGYSFVNWSENSVVVSSEPNYSFAATNNRTLVANFRKLTDEETSVETLSATAEDSEPMDVYSINGQLLYSNVNTLQGLPAGIYVINGKKYVKK
jgi:hypothetical protein